MSESEFALLHRTATTVHALVESVEKIAENIGNACTIQKNNMLTMDALSKRIDAIELLITKEKS